MIIVLFEDGTWFPWDGEMLGDPTESNLRDLLLNLGWPDHCPSARLVISPLDEPRPIAF
jgi:hypothetical protein